MKKVLEKLDEQPGYPTNQIMQDQVTAQQRVQMPPYRYSRMIEVASMLILATLVGLAAWGSWLFAGWLFPS